MITPLLLWLVGPAVAGTLSVSDLEFAKALDAVKLTAFAAPDTRSDVKAQLRGSGVPDSFVDAVFADARMKLDPRVIPEVGKPAEQLPYPEYRKIFLNPQHIDGGKAFLAANAALLSSVEARYGVDRGLLAAFVGVETMYGKGTGRFPVATTLFTLAQQVPARAAFATRELAVFVKLCYKNGWQPFSVMGSYAGAFGFGQFIPSTYDGYAVDFDGDGVRSFDKWPDVLASISNYEVAMGHESGGSYAKGSRNWNAVFAYNHHDNYVQAVIELRDAILAP